MTPASCTIAAHRISGGHPGDIMSNSRAHRCVRVLPRLLTGVTIICLVALSLAVPAGVARAQEADRIRVLIATRDTQDPLHVFFVTKGAVVRGALLPFGGIGNAIAYDARDKAYNATIGPFDRRPTLVAAVEKALEGKYPVFDVVDDGAVYANDSEAKALIARAQVSGIRYVLLIEDKFSGITSSGLASDTHDVSVASALRYELYETAKGERMAKDKLVGNSLTRIPLELALTDRGFLETQMPAVHEALAKLVVGGLTRTDSLSRMARENGHADAVPALGAVLKRYEKPVHITMVPPKGWRTTKFNTRYAMLTEPKSELRFKMGVRADVDLLIAEFGQKVDTVEEYQQALLVRLTEAGFDAATMQPRTDFHKEGYTAVSVTNPTTGGGQLMLLRKIDDLYLSMITIITTENFEGMLTTHHADLQAAIDGAQTEIK